MVAFLPTLRATLGASGTLVLGLLAPTSAAQSVMHTFDGVLAGDQFGTSVRGAGDVDGDGVPDLIVGAPRTDKNGKSSGSARVFSGADGSILHTFYGDSEDDWFGVTLGGGGDVNRDGFDDLIVGAHRDDVNGPMSGSARVYSGADGSLLYTFVGNSAGDHHGYVSGAGDVNGDGFADLIVGAPNDDNSEEIASGRAYVYSGADGSVLHTFDGDWTPDQFGFAVSGAGDVDGDGFDDLIVGARLDDDFGHNSGSARVFSGADGAVLHCFYGDSTGDWFGHSVSGAGDVNGDGFDDLIVGAYMDDVNGTSSGSAWVFSGADGSTLHAVHGDGAGDWLGYSVGGAGDVNGDGFADLIVGAPLDDDNGAGSGSARVISGADGSVLFTLRGDADGDRFGLSVNAAGDVDGDGFADLIVGAPFDDDVGTNAGRAWVFSGCDPLGTSYCGPANLNSSGQSAGIGACGSELAAQNFLGLRAFHLPIRQFGYFLASETKGFVPFVGDSQGNLCLAGEIGRFRTQIRSTGAGGQFLIQVDLTTIPTNRPHSVLPGETWNFQAWFRDQHPGPTSNLTDAVSVTFR